MSVPCLAPLLLVFAGCAAGPWQTLGFRKSESAEEFRKYGPTPAQQIDELKQLADVAADLSNERQQRLSADLADRLPLEQDPQIRIATVRALGPLRSASALDALQQVTQDTDHRVRVAACAALGNQKNERALAALAEVLGSDTNIDVRIAAADALGAFNDPVAMRALGTALDDRDPALQHRAIQSLKSISGTDYGNDIATWRQFADGGRPTVSTPSLAERFRQMF